MKEGITPPTPWVYFVSASSGRHQQEESFLDDDRMDVAKKRLVRFRSNYHRTTPSYNGFNFYYGFICGKILERAPAGDSLFLF
jgi:hypothetical protein